MSKFNRCGRDTGLGQRTFQLFAGRFRDVETVLLPHSRSRRSLTMTGATSASFCSQQRRASQQPEAARPHHRPPGGGRLSLCGLGQLHPIEPGTALRGPSLSDWMVRPRLPPHHAKARPPPNTWRTSLAGTPPSRPLTSTPSTSASSPTTCALGARRWTWAVARLSSAASWPISWAPRCVPTHAYTLVSVAVAEPSNVTFLCCAGPCPGGGARFGAGDAVEAERGAAGRLSPGRHHQCVCSRLPSDNAAIGRLMQLC